MNNEELKTALIEQQKVIFTSVDGDRIKGIMHAIRYSRNQIGGIQVSAEIVSEANSLIVCDPKRIEREM